jgi:transposase
VVKLGSVASSTLTKSGRAMIEALIAGERDPKVLADLSKAKLRNKIPELEGALDSRFEDHHAVQLRQLLDHIDWFDATIDILSQRISVQTEPWTELIERLMTIPGVGRRTAEVILAETGADMFPFPRPSASGLVGGAVPRAQRVGRQAPLGADHPRRRVARGRPHRSGLGRDPHQGHLPAGQVLSGRRPSCR